ncbi:hypothetical protein [Natronomonas sp. EA1]|uniref:hypothetical protein n=1 Tax=Natronomonas sp. EA1 TaxID=3421655 RepID=UPI003EBCA954
MSADATRRTVLTVGFAAFAALLVTALLMTAIGPRLIDSPRLATLLRAKLFISTFTLLVLVVLVAEYAAIYREMPNQFTLSLLLFSVSLMLYAFASNPILPRLLGFRTGAGLGPFTFLPDLFAAIAVVVLLYQSNK